MGLYNKPRLEQDKHFKQTDLSDWWLSEYDA